MKTDHWFRCLGFLIAIVLCTSARCQSPTGKQGLPPFKLVHEDFENPTAFVVPVSTTDKQLTQLVFYIRNAMRSHQYGVLGLPFNKPASRYQISGMIDIFRGYKCVKETYADQPWPCGDDGEHEDAFYQWGLGAVTHDAETRYACDSGAYRKRDGSYVSLFHEENGCGER